MNEDVPSARESTGKPPGYVPGLSAKLLLLTILFIMVAEIFVFVPSVSNFRRQWLMERLAAAQIASLAAEAAPGGQLPPTLRDELLERAKVKAIAVKRADSRELIIEMDMPAEIDAHYDLRNASWLTLIADALMVFVAPDDRIIRVVGKPGFEAGEFIEVVMGEAPLKAAMIRYGLDILGLSILISVITAALVYLSLDALLVKPMTKLTWNIVRFSERPEDPTRIITPSCRRDEIGTAERELASMQAELAGALSQKSRLAALGLAVSKISHDLRNMLSSAQLLSDRLSTVKDPRVQQLVPKLIASLDRADQALRPHAGFRPGAGDAAAAAALPASPPRGGGRRQPRPAAPEIDRVEPRHRSRSGGRCRPRSALPRVEQSLPQRRAGARERRRGRLRRDHRCREPRRLGHPDRGERHRTWRAGAGAGASLQGVSERGAQRRHRAWASPSPPSSCRPMAARSRSCATRTAPPSA